jgi:hypothetical protein
MSQRSIAHNESRKGKSRNPAELENIRTGIRNKGPRIAHNKGAPMSVEQKNQLSSLAVLRYQKEKALHGAIYRKPPNEQTRLKISNTLRINNTESRERHIVLNQIKKQQNATRILENNTTSLRLKEEKIIDQLLAANLSLTDRTDLNYSLICNDCQTSFTRTIQFFHDSKFRTDSCPSCRPVNFKSKAELEVLAFVKTLTSDLIVESGNTSQIYPMELDIYIPELNLAIEYCGLYWHSELMGKSKTYHLKKLEKCNKKGIRLLTILEDEWINHRAIVESRLTNILKGSKRIGARKTILKSIDSKTANSFLAENHLQGRGRSNIRYGLYQGSELVSLMSFSKSNITNKTDRWEINRFATKAGLVVTGAASKLFQAFLADQDPLEVYSFADRRWSEGEVYGKMGFVFEHNSPPSYWYIKPPKLQRFHRFSLRKNSSDDVLKTEWQNRQDQGWNRIWDCGSSLWKWTKP